ncbi:hypothetical protein RHGRI_013792 [Rhododendron griersonianum]|uniref:Uncharacterized protein n=1 Tax=Rhododendron griersonianum TaxID=479676 RepID=A0AAV6K6V2_9ERIC|nr:hypothetical protein RHGRI_013792 [Rhododendron griersonianum]
MKSHSLIMVFNAICIFFLFLLVFYSVPVQGFRPLLYHHSFPSSSIKIFITGRAYSGPSRSGPGH